MRILSVDGGGIRGIIPALVLTELERLTGRPAADLFDLVAGTSTGGLIALGISRSGEDGGSALRAEELVGLYEREGPKIFSRSPWRRLTTVEGVLEEKYSSGPLRDVLRRYLGDARLRDALVDVLVPAYDIERRSPHFFKSARAREDPDRDYAMVDAALATASAPTYFEPALVRSAASTTAALVDGGVFAVNRGCARMPRPSATVRGPRWSSSRWAPAG